MRSLGGKKSSVDAGGALQPVNAWGIQGSVGHRGSRRCLAVGLLGGMRAAASALEVSTCEQTAGFQNFLRALGSLPHPSHQTRTSPPERCFKTSAR